MPKYLTNTTFFNDGLGTYIANGVVQTNKVISNDDIVLSGGISNGSNSITFDETTLFTNIPENMHIYGTGYIDYQGTTYNIGQLLAAFVGTGQISPYPSITYNSTTGETTFTGLLVFPNLSIASGAIINNDFLTYSTNQNVSGQKTFSTTQIFSSIQLNSDLIVNAGGTTILNSNLALVNFLSGTSSNINTRFSTNETNITALQSKTTDLTYNLSLTTTTCAGRFIFNQTPTCSQSLRIDASLLVGTQGNITITNAQLQLIPNISTIQTDTNNLKDKTQYLTFTTNNSTFSQTLNANNLNFTGNISTFSKIQFDNAITFSKDFTSSGQVQINSINTNLSNYALQTTVQSILDDKVGTMIYYQQTDFNIFKNIASLGEIQYTDAGNNKINIVPIITSSQDKLKNVSRNEEFNYFDINSNCHIFNNLILGNIQNVEALINAAMTEATAGLTAALIADGLAVGAGTVAAGAATTASGAATAVEDLALIVEDHTENLIALNNKTSQIQYNSATDRTTIYQTLYSATFELTTLASGFNQTANEQITLAGILTCNGAVNINGTLYLENNNSMIIEGIINQNTANAGTNLFQAPATFFGNVIMSGTNATINATTTQVGTSSASNFNCNSTASFGGDITMLSTKNLRLKNIVPILLDSIYFGGEAGVHLNDDVVFNMKIEANRPVAINNTFQVGTTINRNTSNSYTTTALLDANTGMTLTSPTILITAPLVNIGQLTATSITLNSSGVYIGQLLGTNYLYGTTYVQNLYSASGILGMAGQVFQQF